MREVYRLNKLLGAVCRGVLTVGTCMGLLLAFGCSGGPKAADEAEAIWEQTGPQFTQLPSGAHVTFADGDGKAKVWVSAPDVFLTADYSAESQPIPLLVLLKAADHTTERHGQYEFVVYRGQTGIGTAAVLAVDGGSLLFHGAASERQMLDLLDGVVVLKGDDWQAYRRAVGHGYIEH